MNKNQHDQLKTTFLKIDEALKNKDLNLTDQEKAKFEQLKSQLAGAILSSWLPVDSSRKVMMLVLFLIGLYGIIKINILFVLVWLFLAFFSPRLVGEITIFFGKLFKK
ncbi:MAG: hypothetical protein PHW24_00475 [Candidatus Moranbacteria bacterium]|nr:hypothetical protein [Candidatus Moranbacteria bacterium]